MAPTARAHPGDCTIAPIAFFAAAQAEQRSFELASVTERTQRQEAQRLREWHVFVQACGGLVDGARPSQDQLAVFAAVLARPGTRNAETVRKYVSAVCKALRLPALTADRYPVVMRTLAGVERTLARRRQLAGAGQTEPLRFPVTAALLVRIRQSGVLGAGYSHHLFWLAAVLGVLGLLRGGEFLLVDEFQLSAEELQRRTLRLRHVRVLVPTDGQPKSLRVHIPVTKCAQFVGKHVVLEAMQLDGQAHPLCPVAAWQAYAAARRAAFPGSIRSAPVDSTATLVASDGSHVAADSFFDGSSTLDQQPLLLSSTGIGPLRRADFTAWLQQVLPAVGVPRSIAATVTGHSLRRGGAQSLLDAGQPLRTIKAAGHWRSAAVFRYFTPPSQMAAAFAKASALDPQARPNGIFDPDADDIGDPARAPSAAAWVAAASLAQPAQTAAPQPPSLINATTSNCASRGSQ